MDVLERIGEQVRNNPIVIYMKGTPQFPQCGFSMRAVQALQACGVPFTYVNVLQDPEIFEHLPRFADWPTF
ncbi:MAG: glutaredoxin family protein, partial [Thermochromatium sp.]